MSAITRKDIAAAFDKGHLRATELSYPLDWYQLQDGIIVVVPKNPPDFKFCDDPVAERAWWDRWTKE